jgi:hypothetical protein
VAVSEAEQFRQDLSEFLFPEVVTAPLPRISPSLRISREHLYTDYSPTPCALFREEKAEKEDDETVHRVDPGECLPTGLNKQLERVRRSRVLLRPCTSLGGPCCRSRFGAAKRMYEFSKVLEGDRIPVEDRRRRRPASVHMRDSTALVGAVYSSIVGAGRRTLGGACKPMLKFLTFPARDAPRHEKPKKTDLRGQAELVEFI